MPRRAIEPLEARIAPAFVHPFPLGSLDGGNGFTLNGALANDFVGGIAAAGDVNGDGFGDVIVSASGVSGGTNNPGAAYVVFGKATGFDPALELSTLDGTNGFKLIAADPANDRFFNVSGAGDVNGDGFADVIVGSSTHPVQPAFPPGAPLATGAGAAWVVFGHAGVFAPVDLATLDGGNGFTLTGNATNDFVGISVGAAGDVNGDGFGDVIVGSSQADRAGAENSGAAYVIFGRESGFPAKLASNGLSIFGFAIRGGAKGDALGESVSGAGDVNGDGFDDVIVGARAVAGAGAAYVVYGGQFRFQDVTVSTMKVEDGFKIRGGLANEQFGFKVGAGGDINGDGRADLLIGAGGGGGAAAAKSYVVFSRSTAFPADLNLKTLAATTGFRILAESATGDNAFEIASAGDVNADGFDDLLVGAQLADGAVVDSGAAYLIFGKAGGFADAGGNFLLASLDGTNGVKFPGLVSLDFAGATAGGAGDVNGDGFDDLVFGARAADPGGRAQAGQAYVIFGSDTGAVTHPGDGAANTLTGTVNADMIVGGQADDLLTGAGGPDLLRGGEGDDVLVVSDLNFRRFEGGLGEDTLRLDGAGLALNLTTLNAFQLRGIEAIDLTGSGDNSLTLTRLDLTRLSGESNTLTVFGNAGDAVNFGAGWVRADAELVGGVLFNVFYNGEAKLRVAPGVTTSAVNGVLLGQAGDFKLIGASARDNAGTAIANAGDVNGDGLDDVIIGAPFADGSSAYSGAAYVVFGKPDGFAGGFDLGTLNGTTGFRIVGGAGAFGVGRSVGSAGDFNGDGFADVIVGAPGGPLPPNATAYAGAAYVVFGKADPFAATVDASTLNGNGGFKFSGNAANLFVGDQVGLAGDLNGDGLDDVFVGSSGADGGGVDAGAVHVILGTRAPVQNFDPGLIGFRGFTIAGAAKGDRLSAGGAAGDVNGDGFDDLILGAQYASANGTESGAAYLIYGREDRSFPFKVSDLDGTNGFRLRGEKLGDHAGMSVNGAGDVNGDGLADLLIGTTRAEGFAGAGYVVFGKSGSFGKSFDLSKLTGVNGFEVNGTFNQFALGNAVAPAGDVNGDGFDDLIFGTSSASLRARYSGGAVVVYGKAGGFAARFTVDDLDAQSGFRLSGEGLFNNAGSAVGGGGDFNGDGFDDVLIGAPSHTSANGTYSGAAYVYFGADTGAVTHPGDASANTLTGDANANVLVAGRSDDTLLGMGGADVARGGQGDDVFGLSAFDFRRINGGLGTDTLRLDGAGLALNLNTLGDLKLTGIERIDLTGTGANTLTLSVREVLNLSPSSNTLTVLGDAGDTVNFGAGWIREPDTTIGGDPFRVFKSADGAATLNLSAAIAHPLPGGYVPAFFDGAPGVTINGVGSNNAVSAAGDVNGDGFDDFLVGAFLAAPNGASSGAAYVVFGRAAGFTSPVVLSTLSGLDGFAIRGEAAGDRVGFFALDAAGDFNGDGFADLILGSRNTSGANQSGTAYLVYGKGTAFDPALELSALDGLNGFKLRATASATDRFVTVGGAGDVNGDGFSDVIIGAPNVSPATAGGSGAAYVVFGRATSPGAVFDLAGLVGTNGFAISGAKGDRLGASVSGADVNGDGLSDVIVGATSATAGGKAQAGKAYVIFGKAAGFTATLNAASLKAADGFTLSGGTQQAFTGGSVSSAGDVNGDGVADLIVSANRGGLDPRAPGEAFVVFGKNGGGADVNLTALTGANGFRIQGLVAGGQAGVPVSAAGDVNGDGFDDLIIGSPYGSQRDSRNGEAYVLYGKGAAFTAILDARALDGIAGFSVVGTLPGHFAGQHVAGAGDVNGDGFDDLLVGTYGGAIGAGVIGKSYLIYGFDSGAVTQLGDATPNTLTGTATGDILVAGGDDDTLLGLSTGDSARGGEGDDLFTIDLQTFRRIAGGTGLDTLRFTGAVLGLSLPALPDGKLSGIERIDLRGSGPNTLILNLREVANLSPTSNTLVVQTDPDDFVSIGHGWISQGNEVIGGDSFLVFRQAGATLKLQEGSLAITLVDAKTATFTDVDGDLATIKVNKGTLSFADFKLAPAGTVGGFQLQSINFADDGPEFQDANLTITAARTALGGDGHVNLGFINASGVDLGKVSVAGDLRAIMAGDPTLATPGLDSLSIASMGRFGVSTQGAAPTGFSVVNGKLGALEIDTDLVDAPITALVTASGLGFGSVKIGGSIEGGTAALTGLFTDGSTGAITIGQDLRGGSADGSGSLFINGSIASLSVGGSIVGGSGTRSGSVFAQNALGAVKIGGDLDRGTLVARAGIASLAIDGSVLNARVLAGYNSLVLGDNADATIGAVTVAGDWVASSLVAGVASSDPFFGNGGEALIAGGDAAKIASIKSIAIKGQAIGTPGGADHFGFVAEEIGSFSVGGTKFPLLPKPVNDTTGFDVGGTIDVKVREITTTASPVEPPFVPSASAFKLSDLDGDNGFRVDGTAGAGIGVAMSSAGDVNNDGYDDMIFGAASARPAGQMSFGEVYVVFGGPSGFPATLDPTTLDPSKGFRLQREFSNTNAYLGLGVGAAGYVNDDEFADIIIGALENFGLGGEREIAYVVFGKASFAPVINLATLNGTDGFEMRTAIRVPPPSGATLVKEGVKVTGVGDVDGDGFDDVALATANGAYAGQQSGSAFVVFSPGTVFPALIDLSTLAAPTGFRVDGPGQFANLGYSISAAGDINGDNRDDIIIGAPNAQVGGNDGAAYVVLGKDTAYPASFAAGANGFRIPGVHPYRSIAATLAGVGDINGDGFDDLFIDQAYDASKGYGTGASHVVFGRSSFTGADVLLNSTNGFKIVGASDYDYAGHVGSAGDVNGDGFADLLIGANRLDGDAPSSGGAYVVYGRAGAPATFGNLDLATLSATAGFRMNGVAANNNTGQRVAGAGDVNGDGRDDLIIGAPNAQPTGGFSGSAYVVLDATFGDVPQDAEISADKKSATFVDVDGDLVTVKTTKGEFVKEDFKLIAAGRVGGAQLQLLDLSGVAHTAFAGANITITAARGPLGGDGFVNVGALIATDNDLGKVAIDGDLGQFDLGDGTPLKQAVASLTAQSLGRLGLSTQTTAGASLESNIKGKLGALLVKSDLVGAFLNIDGSTDDGDDTTGAITVTGSIRGGATANSGNIFAAGDLGVVKIGQSIIGGSGAHSGSIEAGTKIASVTLGGSLVGGTGAASGSLIAGTAVGAVKIGGDVIGGRIFAQGNLLPTSAALALAITSLAIDGSVSRANVFAGFDRDGTPANADVQIGAVSIGRDWHASSLAAGVQPDNAFFGDGDMLIPGGNATIARLASITIKGQALGSITPGDHFGFVAQEIGSFKIGTTAFPVAKGPTNDLAGLPVGATGDLRLREV